MDLVLYEAVDQPDVQGGVLGDAAADRQDGQDQAAAWLRKIVLMVIPGLPARADGTEDGYVLP